MKKKIIMVALVFMLGLFITGCGKNSDLIGTWKLVKLVDIVNNTEETFDPSTLVMSDEENGYFNTGNRQIKVVVVDDSEMKWYSTLDDNGNIAVDQNGEQIYDEIPYEFDGELLIMHYNSQDYDMTFEKQK